MLLYARSDTHFLLYIYDQLRNTLLDRADGAQTQVREVLKRSAETALKLHSSVVYNEAQGEELNGWKRMLSAHYGHRFNGVSSVRPDDYGQPGDLMTWGKSEDGYRRERVFRVLHEWRDRTARMLDESLS